MSYDLIVTLSRKDMPTPAAWRAAILEAGFPVELEANFDVDKSNGYRHALVNGEQSGFEYYPRIRDADEMQRAQKAGEDASHDFSVMLAISSRRLEMIAALAAASVLAAMSGGTFTDPQEGESYGGDEAIAFAREQIAR